MRCKELSILTSDAASALSHPIYWSNAIKCSYWCELAKNFAFFPCTLLKCLKVCFPLRESETIVVILWVFDLPTFVNSHSRIPKGLFTIIDLVTGNVMGFRKFKLPSFSNLMVSLVLYHLMWWKKYWTMHRIEYHFTTHSICSISPRTPLNTHQKLVGDRYLFASIT